jgi:hypothetical protein
MYLQDFAIVAMLTKWCADTPDKFRTAAKPGRDLICLSDRKEHPFKI